MHALVELYVAKEPMMTFRLFSNPVFLNASLVGYVATVALFGAEFLMPVYLQSLPRPHRPGGRHHSTGGGGYLGFRHAAGRPAVR